MGVKIDRQALRSRGTQERIVHAALTIIALKGFSAASMDDFCLAAGCSKGGLYHHFRTKTDVLRAVVARLRQADALLPPFAGTEASLGLPGSGVGRVLIEVLSAAARNEELRAELHTAYQAFEEDAEERQTASFALAELIRIGTMVELLTRTEASDLPAAARKLGIERAA